MDLGRYVIERWDGASEVLCPFRVACYQPSTAWNANDGSRDADFCAFVQELADELSALRVRAQALTELTESYLAVWAGFERHEASMLRGRWEIGARMVA